MEEISCGEKVLLSPRYSTSTIGDPSWSTILNGQDSVSFLTVGSSVRRPMRRLVGVVRLNPFCIRRKWHGDELGYSLDIENGVSWVHGSLVLGRLTDQTLLVGEGDERWSGEGTLLVGNDLNGSTLIDGNARVGGTEIDANGTIVDFVSHFGVVCCEVWRCGGLEEKITKKHSQKYRAWKSSMWDFAAS